VPAAEIGAPAWLEGNQSITTNKVDPESTWIDELSGGGVDTSQGTSTAE